MAEPQQKTLEQATVTHFYRFLTVSETVASWKGETRRVCYSKMPYTVSARVHQNKASFPQWITWVPIFTVWNCSCPFFYKCEYKPEHMHCWPQMLATLAALTGMGSLSWMQSPPLLQRCIFPRAGQPSGLYSAYAGTYPTLASFCAQPLGPTVSLHAPVAWAPPPSCTPAHMGPWM